MGMDDFEMTRVSHVAHELIDIQVNGSGMLPQLLQLEGMLVLKETIVHLPESPLCACSFRCDRRSDGEGVDLVPSKMAEHESSIEIREAIAQCLQVKVGAPAVRTLEFPILHQRDGRMRRSKHVVVRRNRHGKSSRLTLPRALCSHISAPPVVIRLPLSDVRTH
jgi:hypothetical protein